MLSRSLLVCLALACWACSSLQVRFAYAQENAPAAEAKAEVETAAEAEAHSDEAHAGGDHGHGGHHADPTIGNGKNLNSLMSLLVDKSFVTAIVFLLMYAILYFVAWKPISEALEKRERTIANNIADAKNASEQALAKLKEYEAKLASAASEATEIVTQARKDAETAGQRLIAEAQTEAARQRDRALADIESAKQIALSEMASKSTDMAFSLARRVVGRELKPADHQQLIQDAVSRLPSRN